MKATSHSSSTHQFVIAMKIFAFVYFAVGLLFFFMPEETFYLINIGPKVFKIFEEIPPPSEHFWIVLTTSMMAMLSAVSLLASMNPRVKGFVMIHLLSKGVSVAGFLYCFFKYEPYFAYLVGAITDLSIFILVAVLHLRTLSEGPFVKENAAR